MGESKITSQREGESEGVRVGGQGCAFGRPSFCLASRPVFVFGREQTAREGRFCVETPLVQIERSVGRDVGPRFGGKRKGLQTCPV